MIVKCRANNITGLPKKLQEFFFRQDSRTGLIDITPGKNYQVYGIQESDLGKFYLVMDDVRDLPWWMPASLYAVIDERIPHSWETMVEHGDFGMTTTTAPRAFHGHEVDIIDSTPQGYRAFERMRREV